MRYLIMCDSFKGTMSSEEANHIIKDAIRLYDRKAQIITRAIADGGEGTLKAFSEMMTGSFVMSDAFDLGFNHIKAPLFISKDKDIAVIEMASVAGLGLKKKDQTPDLTTTFGVGELIMNAYHLGAKTIMIGCGGSATHDGGTGMMAACGVTFYDYLGKPFIPTGKTLKDIHHMDINQVDKNLLQLHIIALTDVNNPLYGKQGAAYIYANQKGANDKMVESLDENTIYLDNKVKEYLNKDVAHIPKTGAAGGLSYGLKVLFDAALTSGIGTMLNLYHIDDLIHHVDIIITGEGKLDIQSLEGKTMIGIAKKAKNRAKVVAFVGQYEGDKQPYLDAGIHEIIETNPHHLPFDQIKEHAKDDLIFAVHTWIKKYINTN